MGQIMSSDLLGFGLHRGAFEDDLRWSVVWEDVSKVLDGSVSKNLAVVELVPDLSWVHDRGLLGYLKEHASCIHFLGLLIKPNFLFRTFRQIEPKLDGLDSLVVLSSPGVAPCPSVSIKDLCLDTIKIEDELNAVRTIAIEADVVVLTQVDVPLLEIVQIAQCDKNDCRNPENSQAPHIIIK